MHSTLLMLVDKVIIRVQTVGINRHCGLAQARGAVVPPPPSPYGKYSLVTCIFIHNQSQTQGKPSQCLLYVQCSCISTAVPVLLTHYSTQLCSTGGYAKVQ